MSRAVIYCRCSTEEESQKDALAKQVMEAEECVQKHGWILVDSYIESRSGTSTKGRNEYNRLFEDLTYDRFEIVVIKSQDRLMRNTKDWYLFVDRLTASGKKLYLYIESKFYSADDALITGIKAILAEEYSRELSKKINLAHRNRQKKGGTVLLTSRTYGYQKMADKSVAVIEEEARVKRRMYELCAAGYGSRRIASILKDDGITNRKGRPFTDADIRRMIRNPLNKGTIVMNRKHYDFDTKRTIKVPEEEQFVYEHKIPAIVPEELWERANQEISARAGVRNKTVCCLSGKNPGKYQLSGKLFCGFCGEPYYRTVRRKGQNGVLVPEWKCRRYLEEGRGASIHTEANTGEYTVHGCHNIHLEEERLLELLAKETEVLCRRDRNEIIRKIMELLENVLTEHNLQTELYLEQLSLEKISTQQKLLVGKLLEGVLTDEVYRIKQEELQGKLEASRSRMREMEEKYKHDQTLQERLRGIEEFLLKGNVIEKAEAGGVLEDVRKIIVYPQYMEVVLSESMNTGNPENLGGRHMEMILNESGASKFSGMQYIPENQRDSMVIKYGNTFHYLEKKREDREKITDLMREKPEITAREIAGELGLSLSGTNYRIKVLKKEGRIRFRGSGGKGVWEVMKG